MAKFSTPPPKRKFRFEIDTFLGIDLSNAAGNVHRYRSPYCPNMIRTVAGKVEKRKPIKTVDKFNGRINGVHFLKGQEVKKIVHAGTKIYEGSSGGAVLYSGAADHISVSAQVGGRLWILDNENFLVWDGQSIKKVSEIAAVPVILIGRKPSGGGVVLNPVNLLQPKRTVQFLGTASDKKYQLPSENIDTAPVLVKKMTGKGEFQALEEGKDFTVNRDRGEVEFATPPGESPVTGEDNVYITYSKTVEGYESRISKCDVLILYGINGGRDRLFVSGNPEYPNYDYFSQLNDPSYYGDTNYSVIGQDSSKIINYSIINEMLVTHKNNAENDKNTTLRKGAMVDGKAAFILQGSYQTSGALAKYSFANMENEPVYVTVDKNISAVTPSDVLGERFSQERSYYITKALKEEKNLEEAFGYAFEGFYYLATKNNIYILDGEQYSLERNRPYSSRQYECYFFPGISARIFWEEGEELYFGTGQGHVKKFSKTGFYNDDGEAIKAFWDTPEIDGNSFANKKTFTYAGCRIAAAPKTGVRISAMVNGAVEEKVAYNNEAQYFDFGHINFAGFTFSTDATPHTLGQKIKIKNKDKVQFRFENSRLNEPFGIYKAVIEYTEGGNKYRK